MASTSPARDTSAVNAVALPPSDAMILTVSSAAAALRSTQNTCAPSRANVTAVAFPLPQPGPIEPAPTTSAVFPLSRSIDFSRFYASVIVARIKRSAIREPRNDCPGFSQVLHPGYRLHPRIVVTL